METSRQDPTPCGTSSDLNATIIPVADNMQRPTKKRRTEGSTDGLSQQLDFIPLEGISWNTISLPPPPQTPPPHGLKFRLGQRPEQRQEVVPVKAPQKQLQKKVKGPAVTPAAVTKDGLSKNRRKKQARAAKLALEANAMQQSGKQGELDTKASGMELIHSTKPSKDVVVLDTKVTVMKPSNHASKKTKKTNVKTRKENMVSYAKTPWMEGSDYSDLPSVQAIFTRELCDFVEYMEPTEEEHQIRGYIFLLVEREVKSLWPSANLVMYGSYRTRVYLPTSDMDMVVHRDTPITHSDMKKLKNHFQQIGIGRNLEFVHSAKVPIIKFHERYSGIAVDISFNHLDGVQSGAITTKLLEDTPGLYSLMIILKHYLSAHDYSTPFLGGVGSYTLMIMIVSFLQMHPHVQSKAIDPEENLGVLLIEFFELYGLCFSYNHVGIAITDGGSYVPRNPLAKKTQSSVHAGVMVHTFDPNDASNDTGRASFRFPSIRRLFERTFTNIIRGLVRRHQLLFTGSTKTMANHRARKQESLLQPFLYVSVEETDHRAQVQKVFYDGTFQKMFSHPPPQQSGQVPAPAEQLRTILPDLIPLEKSGDWLDSEVDQLRSLCNSWQGDQLGMDTMLEMGRQLIIAQSKRTIAVVEERRGAPISDEDRGKIFEETLIMVEKRLSFLEEAVKLHQTRLEIERAQADLRRSEEGTIPSSQEEEVEFVDAMDTDDEEPEHADEDDYFADLMHRASNEYGDSDSDSDGEDEGADVNRAIAIKSDSEEAPLGAGNRNPQNVHISEESILLPQLYSASPSQTHGNSSRDEQIEAMLKRAEGLDD